MKNKYKIKSDQRIEGKEKEKKKERNKKKIKKKTTTTRNFEKIKTTANTNGRLITSNE